jgi:hypothetical protein
MWRTWLVLAVMACGSNEPSPKPAPAPAPMTDVKVEDVAMRFAKAALSGDRQTALSLVLTFDDISKLSKKAMDQKEWDDEITALLDKLAEEGRDFKGTITSAEVVEKRSLDPARDEKVLQKIEFAVVQIHVKEADGREHAAPFPWFFIKTKTGWKYSPKQ